MQPCGGVPRRARGGRRGPPARLGVDRCRRVKRVLQRRDPPHREVILPAQPCTRPLFSSCSTPPDPGRQVESRSPRVDAERLTDPNAAGDQHSRADRFSTRPANWARCPAGRRVANKSSVATMRGWAMGASPISRVNPVSGRRRPNLSARARRLPRDRRTNTIRSPLETPRITTLELGSLALALRLQQLVRDQPGQDQPFAAATPSSTSAASDNCCCGSPAISRSSRARRPPPAAAPPQAGNVCCFELGTGKPALDRSGNCAPTSLTLRGGPDGSARPAP
jgi:hypothetical protein